MEDKVQIAGLIVSFLIFLYGVYMIYTRKKYKKIWFENPRKNLIYYS